MLRNITNCVVASSWQNVQKKDKINRDLICIIKNFSYLWICGTRCDATILTILAMRLRTVTAAVHEVDKLINTADSAMYNINKVVYFGYNKNITCSIYDAVAAGLSCAGAIKNPWYVLDWIELRPLLKWTLQRDSKLTLNKEQ